MVVTLTHARLQEVLDYDPETGILTWKDYKGRNVTIGKQAGCYSDRLKCIMVSIDKKRYIAHRLAWFHYYGYWPRLLDHVDGDHTNNAITNLKQQNVKAYAPKGKQVAKIYTTSVTSEQVAKYIPAINYVINRYIVRCFRGIYIREGNLDVALGNSGWTLRDVQAYLMAEVFTALTHFNPTHVTAEKRTVSESTFVIGHLHKRAATKAKILTKTKNGYNIDMFSLDSKDEDEKDQILYIKGI